MDNLPRDTEKRNIEEEVVRSEPRKWSVPGYSTSSTSVPENSNPCPVSVAVKVTSVDRFRPVFLRVYVPGPLTRGEDLTFSSFLYHPSRTYIPTYFLLP